MGQVEWQVVTEIAGSFNAELIKGLLEAQGIPAILSQEGVGHSVFSVTVGPLSQVEILVPSDLLPRARQVLADYENGIFDNKESQDPEAGDET